MTEVTAKGRAVDGSAARLTPLAGNAETPDVAPQRARTPLVSFVIPCFNSAAYVDRAVEPLLVAAEHIEIVLVDDGSTDDTPAILDRYAQQHPDRVISAHRENGGHGAAMATGIDHATGTYIKILDSDDWTEHAALTIYLRSLRRWVDAGEGPDVVVTNYVYENEGRSSHIVRYGSFLPEGRICTWEDLHRPRVGRYLLMHALTYRADVIRRSNVSFPPHTFYVDNLFASIPMRQVRTLSYIDVDLYRYFIGRADQSVQESVMISRMGQQLHVNRLLIEAIRSHEIADVHHRRYLLHYASIVCSISLTLTALAGTEHARRERKQLLRYIRRTDPLAYGAFRRSLPGLVLSIPGRGGELLARLSYRLLRRRIGFN